MIHSFDQEQIEKTEAILDEDLVDSGVIIALVVDMAGLQILCQHIQ